MSVVTINVWRSGTAGVFAVAAVVLLRPDAPNDAMTPWVVGLIVVSVLAGPGLGDMLYFASLRLIGVARAMPLSGTNPLFAALFATLALGEVVTPRLMLGMALVIVSIYLVAGGQVGYVEPRDARRGAVLAVLAAVLWAVATVAVRPALQQIDPLVANAIRLPAAALVVGLYGLSTKTLGHRTPLTRRTVLILLTIGLITTFSALLFLVGVQQIGAARAATLTSTAPLFGTPLAIMIYREPMTLRLLAGILLSVGGIMLVVGS